MSIQETELHREKPPITLEEKIERSKSTERIDYSRIGCENLSEPLVKITSSEHILVEPFWTLEGDFEGDRYADYIREHPEYDGVYIRPELLQRVEKAAASLDPRYKLLVRAVHRPLEVQRRLLVDCMKDYKEGNPSVSDEEAWEHARTFVGDPDTSSPPHCCGSAIDVDLFDIEKNSLVDFGSPINDDDERSYLHYDGITLEQKRNRMMLLSAMLEQGLASVAFEWWHFSYGDETWAWFYGQKNSLYGLAEPEIISPEKQLVKEMTAKNVVDLIQVLEKNGIEVYVDGGWGVDALLGEQTRIHSDLDIALSHEYVPRLRELLYSMGYKDVPRDDTRDCNFVLGDTKGHEIDVHSYIFDESGQNIFGVAYEPQHLTGKGSINGYPVKCIPPDIMVEFHSGYELDEDDYRDVKALCKRFDIPLPDEYKKFVKD